MRIDKKDMKEELKEAYNLGKEDGKTNKSEGGNEDDWESDYPIELESLREDIVSKLVIPKKEKEEIDEEIIEELHDRYLEGFKSVYK